MSRLRHNKQNAQSVSSALRSTITQGAISRDVNAHVATQVASLESLNAGEQQQLQNVHGNVETELRDIFAQRGPANEVGLESASMVAMAAQGANAYVDREVRSKRDNGAVVMSNPMNGQVGTESYDLGDLSEHMAASVQYNYEAPRQDAFGEALFPTIVASPDQTYFSATAERIMVGDEVARDKTGKTADWARRNLIQAFRDHSILENESTVLVPNASEGDSDFFVDDALVGNTERKIAGIGVPTRPLKFDVGELDLIGLSQNAALISGGLLNHTDQVDPNVQLKNLYIKVASGDGSTTEVIRFPVKHLSGAGFVPSVEGQGRDMYLTFKTANLPLHADSKQVDGSDSTLLGGLAGRVFLSVFANGQLNLDSGSLDMATRAAKIDRAVDDAGAEVAVPAQAESLNIEVIGYDLDARRSNTNQRTAGKLLTLSNYTQAYLIPTTSPFRVQSPALDNAQAVDRAVKALVNATHVAISNSAVTTLLRYSDQLKAMFAEGATMPNDFDPSVFEGIGAQLVSPFYAEVNVDATTAINSISSADKRADIAGYFTALISEMTARIANGSGYTAALRLETGSNEARPHVTIGTGIVMSQFLMMVGDDRILGPQMDYDIVTTDDARVGNKIFLTFTQNKEGFSPLNFGNMVWIPELMGTLNVSRGNSTSKETVVQPRFRHICNLPVLGVINVENMSKLVESRISSDQP